MRKFKRAFCSNTRLMGTMMLMVEWSVFDIDKEPGKAMIGEEICDSDTKDQCIDDSIESHVFMLDVEGLGISDLYVLKGMDEDSRELFYRKKYGGLGGNNIDLTEDQAAYLVKKYRRKNDRGCITYVGL